jgi:hypothetical protein
VSAILLCALSVVALSAILLEQWVEPSDSGGYFTERAAAQNGFWVKAERNRAQFKYVAAEFDTIEQARDALSRLSYVDMPADSSRSPTTSGSIYCGVYPQDGRIVAFVGGPALHYFMWREARDVLAEGENLRLSTPPRLDVHLPSDAVTAKFGRDIELVARHEGTGNDYGYYITYRASSLPRAQAFLQHLPIDLPGVVVTVSTPEGTCRKTAGGITFEATGGTST